MSASEGTGNGQQATEEYCCPLPWSEAPSFKTEEVWERSKSSSKLVTVACSLFPVPFKTPEDIGKINTKLVSEEKS
ncbi:MAG: hypothetical protein QNJ54_05435 [Prochloraceae cyanobacterium]|nr:hypothetical protein [Prochloraceae cyanobacterium]